MKFNINEAKTNFSKVIQSIINGREETIIICKNGKPVAQITPLTQKNSKRIGVAKKEMEGFDISLEEFNKIPTLDFGL